MSIIIYINSIIIAFFCFIAIKKAVFHDRPLGIILAVMGAIGGGLAYLILISWMDMGDSMLLFIVVVYGPIIATILFLILTFAFKGKKIKKAE